MATYLYRLGGWAFRRRKTVLCAWLAVLGLVVASAATFSGQTNDRFSVPGTESQQAQDLLEQKFPGAGGASARMVFAAPEGQKLTDKDNKEAVEASLAQAKKADGVTQVVDPYQAHTITNDGRIALTRNGATTAATGSTAAASSLCLAFGFSSTATTRSTSKSS